MRGIRALAEAPEPVLREAAPFLSDAAIVAGSARQSPLGEAVAAFTQETPMTQDSYHVDICGVKRDLPLFEVAPSVRIALFNMLGDYEVVEALADWLAGRVPEDADAIMTAEVKSIPLAHALAVRLRKPYIVARKTRKPYMVGSLSVEVLSITTGAPQLLWLDGKDLHLVKGKRIVLVDDVICTGSTLAGMTQAGRRGRRAGDRRGGRVHRGQRPGEVEAHHCAGNLPVFLGIVLEARSSAPARPARIRAFGWCSEGTAW